MKKLVFLFSVFTLNYSCKNKDKDSPIVSGLERVEMIATGFKFTEGPAVDKNGLVYFTDQPNDRIHIWDENKGVSLYKQGTRRSNGMYFNDDGNLISCADEFNQLISFDEKKNIKVLHENYNGKHLNAPNDLWIAPNKNIYFTDPYYHRKWWDESHEEIQDTRGVYFLSPTDEIKRVINDFKKPNGIIGTPDGKTLFVADIGDQKIWKYEITSNGSLKNKQFFAPHGSDGMTIDNKGNVYLTYDKIWVYNTQGKLIDEIEVPERPSNVCFGGKNRDILFITARTSVYKLKMNVKGTD